MESGSGWSSLVVTLSSPVAERRPHPERPLMLKGDWRQSMVWHNAWRAEALQQEPPPPHPLQKITVNVSHPSSSGTRFYQFDLLLSVTFHCEWHNLQRGGLKGLNLCKMLIRVSFLYTLSLKKKLGGGF